MARLTTHGHTVLQMGMSEIFARGGRYQQSQADRGYCDAGRDGSRPGTRQRATLATQPRLRPQEEEGYQRAADCAGAYHRRAARAGCCDWRGRSGVDRRPCCWAVGIGESALTTRHRCRMARQRAKAAGIEQRHIPRRVTHKRSTCRRRARRGTLALGADVLPAARPRAAGLPAGLASRRISGRRCLGRAAGGTDHQRELRRGDGQLGAHCRRPTRRPLQPRRCEQTGAEPCPTRDHNVETESQTMSVTFPSAEVFVRFQRLPTCSSRQ